MGKTLPPLLFFTDPQRTPDLARIIATLPRGSAVVLRTFGAADSLQQAQALRALTRRKRLKLLIGADPRLAAAVGADGVHLPERLAHRARAVRRRGWLVTAAAHSPAAVARGHRAGADAAVVSAIFPSRSPSAGPPLGPVRLAAMARRAGLPLYALGGVNDATARRLLGSGAVGVAAVEGLAARPQT